MDLRIGHLQHNWNIDQKYVSIGYKVNKLSQPVEKKKKVQPKGSKTLGHWHQIANPNRSTNLMNRRTQIAYRKLRNC